MFEAFRSAAVTHGATADVAEGRGLEGVMRVGGHLSGDFETFETRFRFEFHDEPDARTRLEVRQWLPAHVTGATEEGWRQSFAELDAHLAAATRESSR